MIKYCAFLAVFTLLFVTPALCQDNNPVRCVITLYRLRGERWKLIKSVDLISKLGEEELTNKRIMLPGSRLHLFASVFPTDESMASAKGADSIKIGLAVSSKSKANAFDLPNNAVAETTLATLDTLRVEQTGQVEGRRILTRSECWDPQLEKTR